MIHTHDSWWETINARGPHEFTVRLMYADWCEEHGFTDIAERMRAWAGRVGPAISRVHVAGPHPAYHFVTLTESSHRPALVTALRGVQMLERTAMCHWDKCDTGMFASDTITAALLHPVWNHPEAAPLLNDSTVAVTVSGRQQRLRSNRMFVLTRDVELIGRGVTGKVPYASLEQGGLRIYGGGVSILIDDHGEIIEETHGLVLGGPRAEFSAFPRDPRQTAEPRPIIR